MRTLSYTFKALSGETLALDRRDGPAGVGGQ